MPWWLCPYNLASSRSSWLLRQTSIYSQLPIFTNKFQLFSCYLVFLNCQRLCWNSLSGSWFGWYAFCCCFHVGIDEVFVFFVWSMCFRYLLKSIKCVSYSYRIFIANISIGERQPVGHEAEGHGQKARLCCRLNTWLHILVILFYPHLPKKVPKELYKRKDSNR